MRNTIKIATALALVGFGLAIHSFGQTTVTNRGQVITVYTGTAIGDRTIGASDSTLQRHEFPRSVLVGYDVAVTRNLAVTGNATIGGTIALTGATTLSTLAVSANATVGGTLGVTGATTLSSVGVSGVATFSDHLVAVPQSSSVTNGAVITLVGVVNNVTATQASTNTVANPGTAGRIAVLVNAGTNNITIAKGANIALSAASHEITPDGTLTLVAKSATEWKELANAKGNTVE